MKIFLCRHGQTIGDIEDRYGGDYDDSLTEQGISQVKGLANKLKGEGIEIIFSSPLKRAKETSEILSCFLGCAFDVVNGIKERNGYGVLTGMIRGEAKEKYPVEVGLLKDYRNTIEGAETYGHFTERIKKSFLNIAKQGFNNIVIVSHGGPIRCLFREFFKWGELKELGDCAFFEIMKGEDGFKLVSVDNATLCK